MAPPVPVRFSGRTPFYDFGAELQHYVALKNITLGDNHTLPEGIMGLMQPKGPVMQPKGRRPALNP